MDSINAIAINNFIDFIFSNFFVKIVRTEAIICFC